MRERKSAERGLLVVGALLVAFYASYAVETRVLAKLAVENFQAKTVPMTPETSQRSPEYRQGGFTPWSSAAIDVYERALTQYSAYAGSTADFTVEPGGAGAGRNR